MIDLTKLVLEVLVSLAIFHVLLLAMPEVLAIERGAEEHVALLSGPAVVRRVWHFALIGFLCALFWSLF